jgi:hypothetical protein
MRHPFETIPTHKRRAIFVPLFVLTIVVMITLNVEGAPLTTEAAPLGIISFEFAGDTSTAQAILDSWDGPTRVRAGFSLGFDFVFLILYSTTIACACAWIANGARDTSPLLATLGLVLAWGQWLAALLDAVENVGLWITLSNGPSAVWLQTAWWCAAAKFTLVILGLLYTILGAAWSAIRKR